MSCRNHGAISCGCCEGVTRLTPAETAERSGLSALSHRVGTHARFKASMLAAISSSPELRALTTRADDDHTIALIDGWATVLDILTFYDERNLNEAYLRTLVERRSVLELARLIGYELHPGVAASTYLAFTLDGNEGSPKRVVIPAGTRAQSVPGQDELPQSFETSSEIVARPEWNTLRPRLSLPQLAVPASGRIYLAGTATNLQRGSRLLAVGGGAQQAFRVLSVTTDNDLDHTVVDMTPLAGSPDLEPTITAPQEKPLPQVKGTEPLTRANLGKYVLRRHEWSATELGAQLERLGWSVDAVQEHLESHPGFERRSDLEIHAFRVRSGLFGHNAMLWGSTPEDWRDENANDPLAPYTDSWEGNSVTTDSQRDAYDPNTVYLERAVPEIRPGSTERESWLLLEQKPRQSLGPGVLSQIGSFVSEGVTKRSSGPGWPWDGGLFMGGGGNPGNPTSLPPGGFYELAFVPRAVWAYRIREVGEESLADYGLSAKVTRLRLSTDEYLDGFNLRRTTAYAASERLPLGRVPETENVAGVSLTLGHVDLRLTPGSLVAIEGERADLEGVRAREVRTLEQVEHDLRDGLTRLIFARELAYAYRRHTVILNANVAEATHGETRHEVLGSGRAGEPHQSFDLKQKPMTYVSAPVPSGGASSLELRVGGIRWHESPDLFRLGPKDRSYVLRRDNDGDTTVLFGDGERGARLPTGVENVTAEYRVGIGLDGLVDEGRISMLASPPLGVREVVNPVPATGGEDPERLSGARENAPHTVRTLDRIVSLRDFEDFARTFAGIAKARADWLWDGAQRVVHVTVAGAGGREVDPASALYRNLVATMNRARDPYQPLVVASFNKVHFTLRARVKADPDHDNDTVFDSIQQALRTAYSFEPTALARSVHKSDVFAVIHEVQGVVAVDLDEFDLTPPPSGTARLSERLDALPARSGLDHNGEPALLGAQLLLLAPGPVELEAMP